MIKPRIDIVSPASSVRAKWVDDCAAGRMGRAPSRFQWSLDASLLLQWGGPDGGAPSLQLVAGVSANYDMFRDASIGDGSIQLAGTLAAYLTGRTGADIGASLGVISAINDWPVDQRQFEQLTYTHRLPDGRFALSIGQYPFSNFDGNRYLNDQQQNFVNYIFAQNGTSTYAAAGLGAYVQFNPTKQLQFALGLQSPNNASVATITTPGLGGSERAWVAYAQWTPNFSGYGPDQYSLTFYESPGVGEQPATRGWSLNAVETLDETRGTLRPRERGLRVRDGDWRLVCLRAGHEQSPGSKPHRPDRHRDRLQRPK